MGCHCLLRNRGVGEVNTIKHCRFSSSKINQDQSARQVSCPHHLPAVLVHPWAAGVAHAALEEVWGQKCLSTQTTGCSVPLRGSPVSAVPLSLFTSPSSSPRPLLRCDPSFLDTGISNLFPLHTLKFCSFLCV